MCEKEAITSLCLDIAAEFIEKRLGKEFARNLKRYSDMTVITGVEPEDGSNACAFDASKLEWFDSGMAFSNCEIWGSGTVFVSYPHPVGLSGYGCFHVGHPREFAELLHLFVQPLSALTAPLSEFRIMKLNKVADVYALFRGETENGWRALDLARLPNGMPREMRGALKNELLQDYDAMTCGRTREPPRFFEMWPELFGALPEATALLRVGYVLRKDRPATRALDLAFSEGAYLGNIFMPILIVPRGDDISTLYLREYLNSDRDAEAHLRAAFSEKNNLDMICALLTKLPITLPSDYTDQVRLAAQANLMRQRVLDEAFQLANCRAPFRQMGVRHQATIHALGRMIEACKICSEES